MSEAERLLAALRARVELVLQTGDPATLLEPGVREEAERLYQMLREGTAPMEASFVLGWLYYVRHQAMREAGRRGEPAAGRKVLPESDQDRELRLAVALLVPGFVGGAAVPRPLVTVLADQAMPAAMEALQRALATTDLRVLTAAVALWRRVVAGTPPAHPDRPMRLSNLGSLLQSRFELTGEAADLEAAAGIGAEAVRSATRDDPNRGAFLTNFSSVLQLRFAGGGSRADLDTAVESQREAVEITPSGHPNRDRYLLNLTILLRQRAERTGRTADLDEAVTRLEREVRPTLGAQVSPSAGVHPLLQHLGALLRMRAERLGNVADAEAAVMYLRAAAEATPAGRPDHARLHSQWGSALLLRYELLGAPEDLDAAVDAGELAVRAVPADDPERAPYLSNLAAALTRRFQHAGRRSDLDAAIASGEDAVSVSAEDGDRHIYLSNLGGGLRYRFELTGALADIDAAIARTRMAVEATRAGHPNRGMYLSNLGDLLRLRYERTGAAADLREAVTAGADAVRITPAGHANRAIYLTALALALRDRFDVDGAMADIDAAVAYLREAVQTSPARAFRAAYSSNLGILLRLRFDRTGEAADLDAAVGYLREAVQAAPGTHPDRPAYLSRLGVALLDRCRRGEETDDLDAAIAAGSEAVETTPPGHPDLSAYLSNLGNSLRYRYERTGEAADLDAAAAACARAVDAADPGEPVRTKLLVNLGHVLELRFDRTGAIADRDVAYRTYVEAAEADSAQPTVRVSANASAAALVAEAEPHKAAEHFERAVLLLPRLAPRSLEREDQQYTLGRFTGLPAAAAALALENPAVPEAERPANALRLLETARGVLLGQALNTRGDLSELWDQHPDLAARFVELRDRLDRPSAKGGPGESFGGDFAGDVARQRAGDERRLIDREFTDLLDRIRTLDGFESFAAPPTIGRLLDQGGQGPVVVFNVSRYRCDALLLASGGITCVALPGLTIENVAEHIKIFQSALSALVTAASPKDRAAAQAEIRRMLAWLWDNAAGPVLEALGHHGPPAAGREWPRVWWAATGLLSLLPIHAAGHHTGPGDPDHRAVLDRVISSYTPTVGALAHARTARTARTPKGPSTDRSLIVAMPVTPGLPDDGRLAHVTEEADLLAARLPRPDVLTNASATTPADRLATRANVLARLPGCSIAHFACHGETDPADPSRSRLLLEDHESEPLTVAELAPVALDGARLAYLSACGTASTTDLRLLNEAVHLSSAFLLAGFPHVIGTLWEIDDAIAVKIADRFYTALTTTGHTFDTDLAGPALHAAIRAVRDAYPLTPSLWAAHLHTGP